MPTALNSLIVSSEKKNAYLLQLSIMYIFFLLHIKFQANDPLYANVTVLSNVKIASFKPTSCGGAEVLFTDVLVIIKRLWAQ